jgi:hypothetical protein
LPFSAAAWAGVLDPDPQPNSARRSQQLCSRVQRRVLCSTDNIIRPAAAAAPPPPSIHPFNPYNTSPIGFHLPIDRGIQVPGSCYCYCNCYRTLLLHDLVPRRLPIILPRRHLALFPHFCLGPSSNSSLSTGSIHTDLITARPHPRPRPVCLLDLGYSFISSSVHPSQQLSSHWCPSPDNARLDGVEISQLQHAVHTDRPS